MHALPTSKMATARAWKLKETFFDFWKYKSVLWARTFLDYGTERAQRSRLEPMRNVARVLRANEQLILNCFLRRVKSRRYGRRSQQPESAHRFC